jgi:hypothetical protein
MNDDEKVPRLANIANEMLTRAGDGSDPEEKFFGTKLDDPGEPDLPVKK